MSDETNTTPDDVRAPSRRERLAALSREEILAAASAVFVRLGYHDTKMSDIAQAAGFPTASLYTYFARKADIVHAVGVRFLDDILAAFDQAGSPDDDLETALRAKMRALFHLVDEREGILRFLMQLRDTGDPTFRVIRGDHYTRPPEERLIEIQLTRLFEAHGFEPSRAADLALALDATTERFVKRWHTDGAPGRFVDNADRVVDIILFGAKGGP